MITYNYKDIKKSLMEVGLKKNDVVFIDPQLYKFGLLEGAKNSNDYYKIFYETIRDLIGNKGTLSINSYSFQVMKYKKDYIHEKTECTSGEFSEFIRKKKESIRSFHPTFSVTSVGRYKKYISSNNSLHNYGNGSPYSRLINLNAKILNLGMNLAENPFFHVAEYLNGVPYYYNKLLKTNCFKNNKIVNKNFISFVRYLNIDIESNYKPIENKMKNNKIYNSSKLGSGNIYYYSSIDYMNCVNEILKKDTCKLIRNKDRNKKRIINNQIQIDSLSPV